MEEWGKKGEGQGIMRTMSNCRNETFDIHEADWSSLKFPNIMNLLHNKEGTNVFYGCEIHTYTAEKTKTKNMVIPKLHLIISHLLEETETIVVTELCLKELGPSSILLHCTIRVGRLCAGMALT